MKTRFLILFIIFNMLAMNIASAANLSELESEHGSHSELELHHDDLASNGHDCECCTHLCHLSSHMVCLVSSAPHLLFTTTHSVSPHSHQKAVSLVLPKPSRPPKA